MWGGVNLYKMDVLQYKFLEAKLWIKMKSMQR